MYKYMNNHFGVSRVFSKARFKAEGDIDSIGSDVSDVGTGGGGSSSSSETDNNDSAENDKPIVESLMAELAAEKAKSLKLQNEKDAASSEAANYKKKLREKMTAEEQISDAKREAEEARQKEFDRMKIELATIQATKRYMTIEMDEEKASETAKAEIAGDMEKVIANIGIHIKEIKKVAAEDALNKFLADRPEIKAGNGDAEKVSLAEQKAKEFLFRKSGTVNADELKRFM